MSSPPSHTAPNRGAWLALIAALLGWMFDGMEMGLFPLVGRPALQELLASPAEPLSTTSTEIASAAPPQVPSEQEVGKWLSVIIASFLVGAATGGVLFGWLGDRLGRVRAMTLSVLTYAVFTFLCGLVTSPWQFGALRFIAALGMGGEWSLGVALVMEVWPNRSRGLMAGLIGAAANAGYMLIGFIGLALAKWWPAAHDWRTLMMVGGVPALFTFLIRMCVPESGKWKEEQAKGATSHWATVDLLGVLFGSCGPALIIYVWCQPDTSALVRIGGTVLGFAVATAGFLYPVARYVARLSAARIADGLELWPTLRRMLLAAALCGIPLVGSWGAMQWAPSWADKLAPKGSYAKEWAQIWSAAGSITGTLLIGIAGNWLGRRPSYCLLCVLSAAGLLALYRGNPEYDSWFLARTYLAAITSGAFFGWIPLYLPELFRTKVRATGQGFGYNFGRIIAAIGALQAGSLFADKITLFGNTYDGGYPFACAAVTVVYAVGLVIIWLGPETFGKPLPD